MSWAADEWKDGLPARALQKIQQLEAQNEKVRKNSEQKQFQLDSLEQALQIQKRKTEEEKSLYSDLKRENQNLSEQCREAEKKRQKLAQELNTKDNHIACIDGQFSHTKQALDVEINKLNQSKIEVERVQLEHNEAEKKLEKLLQELSKLQEYSNHQKGQLESKNERVVTLEADLKRTQGELERANKNVGIAAIAGSGMDATGIKGQLAEMMAQREKDLAEQKRLQEELDDIRKTAATNLQKANAELSAMGSDKAKMSLRLDNQTVVTQNRAHEHGRIMQDTHSMSNVQLQQMEVAVDKLRRESEVLKDGNASLELQLQGKIKELSQVNQTVKQFQSEADNATTTLMNKDKIIKQARDDANKMKVELDQASNKIVELEQKTKKLQQEMNCQRHNAEAAHSALEQRGKDRDREHRQEISQQQDLTRDMERHLQETKGRLEKELRQAQAEQNRVSGQLEKAEFQTNKTEKDKKELERKMSSVDEKVKSHDSIVQGIQKKLESVQNELKSASTKVDDKEGQITRFDGQLKKMQTDLEQRDQRNEQLRGVTLDKDLEIDSLKAECARLSAKIEKDYSHLEQKCKELEAEKDSAEGKLAKSRKDMDNLMLDMRTSKQELETVMAKLETSENQWQKLKIDSQSIQKLQDDTSNLLTKSKEQNKQFEKQLSENTESLMNLQKMLDAKEIELSNSTKLCKDLEDAVRNKDQQMEAKSREHKELCQRLKDQDSASEDESKHRKQEIKATHDELTNTQQTLAHLQKEFDHGKTEISKLQEKIRELSAQNEQLQRQLRDKNGEVEHCNKTIGNLNADNQKQSASADAKLKSSKDERDGMVKHLEDTLTKKSEECHKKFEEINVLMEKLDKAQQHVTDVNSSKAALITSCEEMDGEMKQAKHEKDVLKEEINEIRAKLQQTEKNVANEEENFRTQMAALHKQNDTLQSDYQKACSLADTAHSDVRNLTDQLFMAERDKEKLYHRVELSETTLKTAQDEFSTLKTDNGRLEQVLAETRDQQNNLTSDLQTKVDEMIEKNQQMQESTSKWEQCKDELIKETQMKDQELLKISQSLQSMTDSFNDVNDKHKILLENLKDANILIASKDAEIMDLAKCLTESENQCQKLQKNNSEKSDRYREVSDMVKSLENQVLELQINNESLKLSMELKEKECTMLEEKCCDLSVELSNWNAALREKSEAFANQSSSLQQLQDRLSDSNEKMDTFSNNSQNELERLRSQLDLKDTELTEAIVTVQSLKLTNDELRTSIEWVKEALEEKEKVVTELGIQCDQLQHHVEEAQTVANSKASQFNELMISSKMLEEKLAVKYQSSKMNEDGQAKEQSHLQSKLEIIQMELKEKESLIVELNYTITNKDHQLHGINTTYIALQESNSEVLKDQDQNVQKIESLTKNLNELRNTLSSNQDKSSDLQGSINARLSELKEEKDGFLQETHKLKSNLEMMQMDMEDKDALIESLNVTADNLQSNLTRMVEERARLQEQESGITVSQDKLCMKNEALKKELDAVKGKMQEAHEKSVALHNDLQTKISLSEEERHKVLEEMNHQTKEMETLEKANREQGTSVDSMQNRISNQEQKINSLLNELQAVQTSHANECSEKQSLGLEAESLKNEVFKYEKELEENRRWSSMLHENHREKLIADENSTESAEVEKKELLSTLEAKVAKIETLEADLKETKEQLHVLQQHCETLQMDIEAKDDAFNKLKKEGSEFLAAHMALEENLQSATESNSDLKNDMNASYAKVSHLETELSTAQENLTDLTRQLTKLRQNHEILSDTESSLGQEMQCLQNDLSICQNKLMQIEMAYKEKEEKISQLEGIIKEMENKVNERNDQIAALEETISDANRESIDLLHGKGKELEVINREVETLNVKNIEKDAQLKSISDEMKELDVQYSAKCEHLQDSLNEYKTERNHLEERIKSEQNEVSCVKQQMLTHETEIQHLTDTIREMEEKSIHDYNSLCEEKIKWKENEARMEDYVDNLRRKVSCLEGDLSSTQQQLINETEIQDHLTKMASESKKEKENLNLQLQARIAELQEKLALSNDEVASLQNKLCDDMASKDNEHQEMWTCMKQELQSLKDANRIVTNEKELLSEKISEQESIQRLTMQQQVQRCDSLEEELSITKEKLHTLTRTNAEQWTSDIQMKAKFEQDISELKNAFEEKMQQYSCVEKSLEEVKFKLQNSLTQFEQLMKEHESLKLLNIKNMDDLNIGKLEMDQCLLEKQMAIDEKEKNARDSEAFIQNLQMSNSEISCQLERTEYELNDTRQSMNRDKEDVMQELLLKKKELADDIHYLEKESNTLKERIQQSEKTQYDLKTQLAEQDSTIIQLQEALKESIAGKERFESELATKELLYVKNCMQLENKISNLREELSSEEEYFSSQEVDLNRERDLIASLERQLVESSTINMGLNVDVTEKIKSLENKLSLKEDEFYEMQKEISERNASHKEELHDVMSRLATVKQNCLDVQQTMATERTTFDNKLCEIESSHSLALEVENKSHESLQNELEICRESLRNLQCIFDDKINTDFDTKILLQEELSALKLNNEEKDSIILKMEKDLNELLNRLSNKVVLSEELEKHVAELKVAVQTSSSNLEDTTQNMQEKCNSLKSEVQMLHAKASTLEHEYETLKQSTDACILSLEKKISEITEQNDELLIKKTEVEDQYQMEYNSVRLELKEVISETLTLKKRLEVVEQSDEHQKESLSTQKRENDEINNMLKCSRAVEEKLHQDNLLLKSKLEDKIQKLEHDSDLVRQELTDKSTELSDCQEKLLMEKQITVVAESSLERVKEEKSRIEQRLEDEEDKSRHLMEKVSRQELITTEVSEGLKEVKMSAQKAQIELVNNEVHLHKKMSELKETNNELTKELLELKVLLFKTEQHLQSEKDLKIHAKTMMEDTKNDLKKMKIAADENASSLSEQLSIKTDLYHELERTHQGMISSRDADFQERNSQFLLEKQQLQDILKHLQADKYLLESQINEKDSQAISEMKEHQESICKLEEDLAETSASLCTAQESLRNNELSGTQRVTKLENELSEVKEHLQSRLTHIVKLEEELAELQANFDMQSTQLITASQELEKQTQLAELQTCELKSSKNEHDSTVLSLQSEIKQLSDDVNDYASKLEKMASNKHQMEFKHAGQVSEFYDRISETTADREQLQRKYDSETNDLLKSIDELERKVSKMKEDLAESDRMYSSAQEKISDQDHAMQKITETLNIITKERNKGEKEFENAKRKTEEKVIELNNANDSLKKDIKHKADNVLEAQQKLELEIMSKTYAETKLKNINKEIEIANDKMMKTVKTLENNLIEKESALCKLADEMSEKMVLKDNDLQEMCSSLKIEQEKLRNFAKQHDQDRKADILKLKSMEEVSKMEILEEKNKCRTLEDEIKRVKEKYGQLKSTNDEKYAVELEKSKSLEEQVTKLVELYKEQCQQVASLEESLSDNKMKTEELNNAVLDLQQRLNDEEQKALTSQKQHEETKDHLERTLKDDAVKIESLNSKFKEMEESKISLEKKHQEVTFQANRRKAELAQMEMNMELAKKQIKSLSEKTQEADERKSNIADIRKAFSDAKNSMVVETSKRDAPSDTLSVKVDPQRRNLVSSTQLSGLKERLAKLNKTKAEKKERIDIINASADSSLLPMDMLNCTDLLRPISFDFNVSSENTEKETTSAVPRRLMSLRSRSRLDEESKSKEDVIKILPTTTTSDIRKGEIKLNPKRKIEDLTPTSPMKLEKRALEMKRRRVFTDDKTSGTGNDNKDLDTLKSVLQTNNQSHLPRNTRSKTQISSLQKDNEGVLKIPTVKPSAKPSKLIAPMPTRAKASQLVPPGNIEKGKLTKLREQQATARASKKGSQEKSECENQVQ